MSMHTGETTSDERNMHTNYLPAMPSISAEAMESALTIGDLSKMSPAVRVRYYLATCGSAGLNPLTRPFTPLKGQDGQVTLYANKDAAEQLRKRDRVSLRITSRVKEDGLYILTVEASTPDGRVEESQGIVEIGKLQGTALANAMMRAETKAKRRATLAICGLGFPLADSGEYGPMQPMRISLQTGEIHGEDDDIVLLPGVKAPSMPEELHTDTVLVDRINVLLEEQGLSIQSRQAWWKKMDEKYAGRSPFTLTMLYEKLQKEVENKRNSMLVPNAENPLEPHDNAETFDDTASLRRFGIGELSKLDLWQREEAEETADGRRESEQDPGKAE